MNLDALKAHIKSLDCSYQPAISDAERAYFRYYGIDFEARYEDVVHHFGHFECDRFDIVAHYYEKAEATATCFLLHGYLDHAGLYGKLIDYCLQRNWSVVIFDLPGHGLSTGERASITSFADYQVVFKAVLMHFEPIIKNDWYVIAQSTGGAIVMDYLLSGGEGRFKKIVLLAPLFRPSAWWLVRMQLALVAPFLKRIKRRFAVNSHDEQFLHFLKHEDPLQYRYISIEWVMALKIWMKHFSSLPVSNSQPLIIQGKEDATVDWSFNLPLIKTKFPRAKLFEVQQGRHHLVNEREDIRQITYQAMDLYFDSKSDSTEPG